MPALTRTTLVRTALAAAALAFTACAPLAAHAQTPYRVLHHWQIGGDGGWDYMTEDPAAHRLYLAHGPVIDVVDTHTGTKVGAITGLQGTHGVALEPSGKYGYISDGRGNSIVVFDRHSLEKVATVAAGTNPDGIAYEPVTRTVWAFNGRSNSVSVLDTNGNKIVATIALPGKPEFPVADGRGFVFDNIESKNELVKLNAKTHELVATYPLNGCESPSGLAIDTKGRRLISVCDNKEMAVTSADTGKVLALVPIGEGPDATRYDARLGLAFSTNGESGNMTVVNMRATPPQPIQTLETAPGARTIALDESTGDVYTVTAKIGSRPAPSASNPHGRPTYVPGSFEVIVMGR